MKRRTALTSLLALPVLAGHGATQTATRALLQNLEPSPRMPVLFVGHGSPMNAIEDTPWRRSWQALGKELLSRSARPQLILCISAHWITEGSWMLTGQAAPPTIHDFGGFPKALFDQQYPAPGAPQVAQALAAQLKSPTTDQPLGLDTSEWGYDHGTWSVLKPMFPQANIPVLQLSMDYRRPPSEHYQLGQQLRQLRNRGVLIVGSGNVVHNLRATRRDVPDGQAYDWAKEFDAVIQQQIAKGELGALQNFLQLGNVARMAHPTHDHFLPLLYAAGAASGDEMPRFFNTGFQSASISMRSVLWG